MDGEGDGDDGGEREERTTPSEESRKNSLSADKNTHWLPPFPSHFQLGTIELVAV